MKEKDLYVDFKLQQSIYYVEKEDASYGPVISGSSLAKYYLEDHFDHIKKWEQSLRDQLKKGEISPVYYNMIMQSYGEGDLASRVKISRRKLRQHFQMKHFVKMKLLLLKQYAEAFDIPVVNMFQLMITKKEDAEQLYIDQIKTKNPYFVILKLETRKKG